MGTPARVSVKNTFVHVTEGLWGEERRRLEFWRGVDFELSNKKTLFAIHVALSVPFEEP